MAFPDGIADFRSDTVTRPTPRMIEAMANAVVGDDVYHDDPTVNLLEEESASVTGKEAAVFVPTGTMGNQLSIMFHTNPGEEVLAHEASHVRSIEAGAPQALSGVGFRTVAGEGGRISPADVDEAMRMAGFFPRISLMVWENTHNLAGGRVIPIEVMETTSQRAREHGLSIHIDGARIFNAVAATGIDAARWASTADTIQFCFSKGLGAPLGSVVCGPGDMMSEIRYLRKRLGGGMRQVGVVAAAARVALAERDRLIEDHILAQKLASALGGIYPGSVGLVETNMVRLDFDGLGVSWEEVSQRLVAAGIRVNPPFGGSWRLVTHRDVDAADVDRLVAALS
ncbi:MAG: beta-eliminating lyase-related protein [Actinobacteria bacterium]|nr:beta-eliminating lyase-related protein [Actinomycetota bacterium]MCI0677728.1 beta-eliminating lyase-related protein [Actinomycetota bacterium]